MKKFIPLLVGIAALIVGLTAIPLMANGLSIVAEFDAAAGELPESLAVDRKGNIYVGMALTGEIKKVTPEGDVSSFASLPPGDGFLLGMAFGKGGQLYVALASFDGNHGIWRVSPGGAVRPGPLVPIPGSGLINSLAFDDDQNLFVSDSTLGTIWRIPRGGTAEPWVNSDPLLQGDGTACSSGQVLLFKIGANGIAFDKDEQNLYVANTDFGRIVRIPVEDNGSAGTPEVFVEDCAILEGADGITFDADKNLYVAVNHQDRLAVISEEGEISVLAEGGLLQFPAEVRFGKEEQKDTLYITNFALLRALDIKPGDPNPALLTLLVE